MDVKDSTALPNKSINDKMKQLEIELIKINKDFSKQIAIPLSISYGDEIAGLFNSPENLYNIVIGIRKILYPLTSIRFASVKGKISTESKDIRKVGGPIFKKASIAMNNLKETNGYAFWQFDNEIYNKSLGSLCEISNALINDMSIYQREVYELLKTGLSQREIATQLGKYSQSVWDAVQRSKAVYVIEAQKTINMILASCK